MMADLPMMTYPADEHRIWDVERGRSWNATVPLAYGQSLAAGDSILFALANGSAGQEPAYVKGGDSVMVVLTDVTELGTADPATGKPLYQIAWKPLGQAEAPVAPRRASAKPSGARGRT